MLPGMWMSVNNKEMSERDCSKGNRFIRVSGLKRHEAGFLDHFDGKHPEERFVLHDKHDRRGFAGGCVHHINAGKRFGPQCVRPGRNRPVSSPLSGP